MTHEQEIIMLNETLQMCMIETAKSQSENQQLKELLKECNYLMFESVEYTEDDLDRLAITQDKLKEIID